jgi:hypothetical protein
MEWRHDVETKDLNKASEAEITEALVVQERELEMEGFIFGAELKAMQERRMLNSLLDSFQESIISTDPRGTLSRSDYASELLDSSPGWVSRRRNDFRAWRAKKKERKTVKASKKRQSVEEVLEVVDSLGVEETEKGNESDSVFPAFGCETAPVPGEVPMNTHHVAKADIILKINLQI